MAKKKKSKKIEAQTDASPEKLGKKKSKKKLDKKEAKKLKKKELKKQKKDVKKKANDGEKKESKKDTLKGLHCNHCKRHCPLIDPHCGKGRKERDKVLAKA